MRDKIEQAIGFKNNNNMYRMFFRVIKQDNEVNVSTTSLREWHERLGHLNRELLKKTENAKKCSG